MNKYYAVLTPNTLGIFTQWADVEKMAIGVKGAKQKSFSNYDEAVSYILSALSDMDKVDFGLNKNPLYLNRKFVRKAQYIAEKETKSKRGE